MINNLIVFFEKKEIRFSQFVHYSYQKCWLGPSEHYLLTTKIIVRHQYNILKNKIKLTIANQLKSIKNITFFLIIFYYNFIDYLSQLILEAHEERIKTIYIN